MTPFVQKIQIRLPNGSERDFFHRGSAADLGVIDQIFGKQDYSLDKLRRGEELFDVFSNMIRSGATPLIIDAGANIGASALWFSIAFPRSRVLCFEPDPSNFKLLEMNTAGLNVELYQAAIGATDGFVDMIDPGLGEWGYQTNANPSGATEKISLGRVVKNKAKSGLAPFVVKIDIEGGEKELFSSRTNWVSDFPLLIIELHDWLLPKKRTSANFIKTISSLDRDFVHLGENIFSIRN